jgi:hypothetical protein
MNLDELKKDLIETQSDIRSYLSYSEEYLQLKVFKILSKLLSNALQSLLIGTSIAFILFFVSVGISLALGELFESYIVGTLTVAAFYALVALILYVFRNRLSRPVLRTFSSYYFDEP